MRRAIVLAGLGAVMVTGCGDKAHDDAGIGNVDRARREVIAMPNDFGNVSQACDGHGHRVYVTTNTDSRPSSLFVLNDVSCSK